MKAIAKAKMRDFVIILKCRLELELNTVFLSFDFSSWCLRVTRSNDTFPWLLIFKYYLSNDAQVKTKSRYLQTSIKFANVFFPSYLATICSKLKNIVIRGWKPTYSPFMIILETIYELISWIKLGKFQFGRWILVPTFSISSRYLHINISTYFFHKRTRFTTALV